MTIFAVTIYCQNKKLHIFIWCQVGTESTKHNSVNNILVADISVKQTPCRGARESLQLFSDVREKAQAHTSWLTQWGGRVPEGPQGCGGPEGTGFWVSPSTLRLWGVEWSPLAPRGEVHGEWGWCTYPPLMNEVRTMCIESGKQISSLKKKSKHFLKGHLKSQSGLHKNYLCAFSHKFGDLGGIVIAIIHSIFKNTVICPIKTKNSVLKFTLYFTKPWIFLWYPYYASWRSR